MDDEQIKTLILKKTREIGGRSVFSCRQAHIMAEELDITLQDIGRICNELGIKIVNCQLGCFGGAPGE